jgi:hypothetical protein
MSRPSSYSREGWPESHATRVGRLTLTQHNLNLNLNPTLALTLTLTLTRTLTRRAPRLALADGAVPLLGYP